MKIHGERDGTRALIEVLLLGRHMTHERVVAGLAAALRAEATTADAVADGHYVAYVPRVGWKLSWGPGGGANSSRRRAAARNGTPRRPAGGSEGTQGAPSQSSQVSGSWRSVWLM
ncbi:hypothetical protein ACFY91_24635 [Streptomyces albogriseolus]|uniref:hypothetical protein n=1 Tax=Streptomyces albogriseolus TaxID=1887 RepID=UPI0036F12EA8